MTRRWMSTRRAAARLAGGALALALVGVTAAVGAPAAAAADGAVEGVVASGGTGLAGYEVTVLAAGAGDPVVLGSATTGPDGGFSVATGALPSGATIVATAERTDGPRAGDVVLSAVLGVGAAPPAVTVNELTTIAAGYALAQFTHPATGQVRGPSPGLPNAVGMAHNLVDPATGQLSAVLTTSPNAETATGPTINGLANALAACVDSPAGCDALFAAATSPEGRAPTSTQQAVVQVAHDPWHQPAELFAASGLGPAPYQPVRDLPPAAWTLAVRFDGDGQAVDGPGNFAIDHEGSIWVANNYSYSPSALDPSCSGQQLLRFTPDGRTYPGSPYTGGGLSGAGYGITIDRYGDVWVANFGFAGKGCDEVPPSDSLSRFTAAGVPLSPAEGYTEGGVDWPQGIAADPRGTIWVANCNDGSVTRVPEGDPTRAENLDVGLEQAFDVSISPSGTAFVTGIADDRVAMLAPDGTPLAGSPISGSFRRPMGIAGDAEGYQWIANSGLITLPCPNVQTPDALLGSLALLGPDGSQLGTFTGGGLDIPWGVSVDGEGNVWVSDFAGLRISQFCGVPEIDCRPGGQAGDPISPDVFGYEFDGLTRSTATAIDPSGNVWATNNWKLVPLQENPGGNQIVAFVGLGSPVQPPAPDERPSAPSTTTTTAAAGPDLVPRFTG